GGGGGADQAGGGGGPRRQPRRCHSAGVVHLPRHPGQHVDDDDRGGDGDEPQLGGPPQPDEAHDGQRYHQQSQVDELGRQPAEVIGRGGGLLVQGGSQA